jgi:hypothetical protein
MCGISRFIFRCDMTVFSAATAAKIEQPSYKASLFFWSRLTSHCDFLLFQKFAVGVTGFVRRWFLLVKLW